MPMRRGNHHCVRPSGKALFHRVVNGRTGRTPDLDRLVAVDIGHGDSREPRGVNRVAAADRTATDDQDMFHRDAISCRALACPYVTKPQDC
jgi:hypothetical protein